MTTAVKKRVLMRWLAVALVIAALTYVVLRVPPIKQTPLAPGRAIPTGFIVKDVEGKTRKLSEWDGRVRLISFWATWCGPCIEEMPTMQVLADHLKGEKFIVLGVNVEDDSALPKIKSFIKEANIQFPILRDLSQQMSAYFNVSALPLNLIVDAQNHVVLEERGARDWSEPQLISQIEELLKLKDSPAK